MEGKIVAYDDNSCDFNSNSTVDDHDISDSGGNPKLADAINKVLRIARTKDKTKSIILSKAKLYDVNKRVKKETCGFEIEPQPNLEHVERKKEDRDEDLKPDVKEEKKTLRKLGLAKHEKLKRGRVIPSALDKDKERHLSRIATRGVVQLFNAVKQHQSTLEKKLSGKNLTEVKRENILKSVDKNAFLNALSGAVNISLTKNVNDDKGNTEVKEEEMDENSEKPSWEVLRNDFMMGAKLKDWDKKAENEELSD